MRRNRIHGRVVERGEKRKHFVQENISRQSNADTLEADSTMVHVHGAVALAAVQDEQNTQTESLQSFQREFNAEIGRDDNQPLRVCQRQESGTGKRIHVEYR